MDQSFGSDDSFAAPFVTPLGDGPARRPQAQQRTHTSPSTDGGSPAPTIEYPRATSLQRSKAVRARTPPSSSSPNLSRQASGASAVSARSGGSHRSSTSRGSGAADGHSSPALPPLPLHETAEQDADDESDDSNWSTGSMEAPREQRTREPQATASPLKSSWTPNMPMDGGATQPRDSESVSEEDEFRSSQDLAGAVVRTDTQDAPETQEPGGHEEPTPAPVQNEEPAPTAPRSPDAHTKLTPDASPLVPQRQRSAQSLSTESASVYSQSEPENEHEGVRSTQSAAEDVSHTTVAPQGTPSSQMQSPLQDLSDTFENALADLGIDQPPPVDGIADVSVSYRGLLGDQPRVSTSLNSLGRVVTAPAPATATPQPQPKLATPQPQAATATPVAAPKAPAQAPPLESRPGPHVDVYGFTVWWPTCFDMSNYLHWGSMTPQAHADAFNSSGQELSMLSSHLDVWINHMRGVRPSAPASLIATVRQEQAAKIEQDVAHEEAMDPDESRGELGLPANIPYPGAVHLHRHEHATPSMRSAMTPSTTFGATPLPRTPEPRASGMSRVVSTATSLAPPSWSQKPASPKPASALTPNLSSLYQMPEARHGLGIPGLQTDAPEVPRAPSAIESKLAKMLDALPDADEMTLRTYLVRSGGDDYKAMVRFY